MNVKLDYLENGSSGENGYIPSPIDSSQFSLPQTLSTQAVLPSAFDLRTTGQVSSVKNQGKYGLCWTFAATASEESGWVEKYPWINLSEKHLTWSSYGFDDSFTLAESGLVNGGGWNQMSAATLSHYFGPTAESAYPYSTVEDPITEAQRRQADFHLQDVSYLPSYPAAQGADRVTDAIKKTLLMNQGALSVAFKADSTALDGEHCSFYNSEGGDNAWANHQVTLVGWDDSFPKENFVTEAPGDGAWLIKNSWGTGLGYQQGGYCWISYYDQSMVDGAFYTVSEDDTDQSIQYYDATGWKASLTMGVEGVPQTQLKAANVFTAEKETNLEAVGLYTTDSNINYRVEVYTKAEGVDGQWTASAVSTKTDTEPYAGYHTIPLDTPIALSGGQQYAIVYTAENTNTDENGVQKTVTLPFEQQSTNYSNTSKATIHLGESYIYSYNDDTKEWEWLDIASEESADSNSKICNLCVSAITGDGTSAVQAQSGTAQALLSSLIVGDNERTGENITLFDTTGQTKAQDEPTVLTNLKVNLPEGSTTAYLWPIATGTITVDGKAVTQDGIYKPIAIDGLKAGENTVELQVTEGEKSTTDYKLTVTVAEPTPAPSTSVAPTTTATTTVTEGTTQTVSTGISGSFPVLMAAALFILLAVLAAVAYQIKKRS